MLPLGVGQLSFFLGFAATAFLYVLSEIFNTCTGASAHVHAVTAEAAEEAAHKKDESLPLLAKPTTPKATATSVSGSGLVRCLVLDKAALVEHRATLRSMVEMGCLMTIYFVCDRTSVLPTAEKDYSRDVFLFMFLILTCVAYGSSRQQFKVPLLLNRPQTEEWKGWMQVLFLFYHYFDAREAYNAIRVFIAGYVWMTGFGNFSYYYKTSDFSIGRFAQMMWRLNFLVLFACLALGNSYMLYYICPMHTIYTVFVYLALLIGSKYNKSHLTIIAKLLLSVVAIEILWNKTVFYSMWSPFTFLVGYLDPRKPDLTDALHEWYFRSALDRYVWIWGMLCAYTHPLLAKMYARIDSLAPARRYTTLFILKAVIIKAALAWYFLVYRLPKLEYNRLHPYTSWIPITCFFLLRNLTPALRTYHLRLYGWLGCITLETYISQFHIWLHTGVPDGQPKLLLSLLPGYPLLNFALCTAIYVYISYRLFLVTNALKNAFVPHDDNPTLARNIVMMAVTGGAVYVVALVVHFMALGGGVPVAAVVA